MVDLSMVKKVTVVNWTDYDPNLCCNGGKYLYETIYRRRNDGKWDILYGTSADFEFCPYCGMFGDSCGCDHPEQASMDDVQSEMVRYKDNPNFTVEIVYEDGSEVEL